jgi:hypothetical protein
MNAVIVRISEKDGRALVNLHHFEFCEGGSIDSGHNMGTGEQMPTYVSFRFT